MSRSCSHEDLEALVEGGLSPEIAADVGAHAAGCAECGDELKWLRAERELMRRRAARTPLAPNDLAQLWSGVESRLGDKEKPLPKPVWLRPASLSFAVAAAAVLAFVAGRHAADRQQQTAPIQVSERPGARLMNASARVHGNSDTVRVLDEAEEEWRSAAGELEERYLVDRRRLKEHEAARIDRRLANTRRAIAQARTLADGDVEARVAVLDGYAGYVRSLQTLVSDLEVAK